MDVTLHGSSCVRLRGREVNVVVDPPDGTRSLGRNAADIIIRTSGETEPDRLRPRPGEPQEIRGPGEFEVRGVRVRGLSTGRARTIMQIELDEVRIVALGTLDRALTEEEIDSLGKVDLLVIPVGAGRALAPSAATKLVNAIAPAVVVPIDAPAPEREGDATVELFAKEMGLPEGRAPQPKLSLSPSSVASEDTRVVLLEPRGA